MRLKKLLLIIVAITASIAARAQIFQYPNPGNYGTGQHRSALDSVFYFPTGCGVPSGTASLRSYGFNGFGEKLKQAAIYYDSCGHNFYVYDPSDSTWSLTGGGGGSPNTSLGGRIPIAITGTNNVKSVDSGYGIKPLDTTTIANVVKFKVDTNLIAPKSYVNSTNAAQTTTIIDSVFNRVPKVTILTIRSYIPAYNNQHIYLQDPFANGIFYSDTLDVSTADDSVMTFVTSAGQRWKRLVTTNYLNVKWWGATGNGATDDYAAIQKAFNYVIANNTTLSTLTLYFPHGTYSITKPLIAAKWTGTDYAFFTLNILGEESSNFTVSTLVATIAPTFKNTFAIGYQVARSSTIRGLVISGQFSPSGPGDWLAYYERPFSTWVSSQDAAVRDSVYSPYAGIDIEPFRNTNTTPPDGGYPGLSAYYRGTGALTNSGSSGLRIENCHIYGFTVDVMITPNGQTSNAENIQILNCALEVAKVAVATGFNQSKDNFIKNAISWDRVHTLIDNVSYGLGVGQPPYVDGWNAAGTIIRVFNVSNTLFNVAFNNLYAEQIYQIGTIAAGSGTISINDCNFHFNVQSTYYIPPYHADGGASFNNCTIRYYDNNFDKRAIFKGAFYFNNCVFDDVPIGYNDFSTGGTTAISTLQFTHCSSKNGSLLMAPGQLDGHLLTSNPHILQYGDLSMREGGTTTTNDFIINSFEGYFRCGNYYRKQAIGATVFNMTAADSVNRTARCFSANTNSIAVGDYLVSDNPWIVYGRIDSINTTTDSFYVQFVPVGINPASNNGSFTLVAAYYDVLGGAFIGDLTNTNDTIKNVTNASFGALPYVGQRLQTTMNLNVPIIRSISGTNIIMSQNSDYTQANYWNPYVSRFSQKEKILIRSMLAPKIGSVYVNSFSIVLGPGTEWLTPTNHFSGADTIWKCTFPGVMDTAVIGGHRQTTWKPIDPLYVTQSIVNNSDGSVDLINDSTFSSASPYYYGAASGRKGWYPIPGGLVDSATLVGYAIARTVSGVAVIVSFDSSANGAASADQFHTGRFNDAKYQPVIIPQTVGSSPNNNGVTISGTNFTLQPADSSHGGVIGAPGTIQNIGVFAKFKKTVEFDTTTTFNGVSNYTGMTGGVKKLTAGITSNMDTLGNWIFSPLATASPTISWGTLFELITPFVVPQADSGSSIGISSRRYLQVWGISGFFKTLNGDFRAGFPLTITSTSNATKGTINLGQAGDSITVTPLLQGLPTDTALIFGAGRKLRFMPLASQNWQQILTNGSTLTGNNSVTNTAQNFTWINGGTGLFKLSGFLRDTANSFGLVSAQNDSSITKIPWASVAAKVAPLLPTFNIYPVNGLQPLGSTLPNDSLGLGGTLYQNTTISGSNAFAFMLDSMHAVSGHGFKVNFGSDAGWDLITKDSATGFWTRIPKGTPGQVLTMSLSGGIAWGVGGGGGGGGVNTDVVTTITSGSSSTVPNGTNIIQFNPTSLISAYTLTLPTTWHNSNDLVIAFTANGTITAGNTMVTTLTIVNGSGQTLSQISVPTTGQAGEIIRYHLIGSVDQRYN